MRSLEVSQGSVELVDPTEISHQPRHHVGGLGLRGEVTPRFGALTPAPRVTEGFVAEADEPRRARRGLEQREAVRVLDERVGREAQRLIGRAPLEVVRGSLLREVEELVVVTRAERVLREPRDVGALRLAQRSEGSLVQSAAFATEELILDRVSHERVAEHELVGTVLGDEAAVDEPAEVTDQLLLVHAGDRGEHVERRAPAEHRGGIDHAPLVAAQPVELATDDLRERERQRLRGEALGVGVTRRAQDLLEEERVAASAGVERGCRPRRKRSSVHAREEVRDLRLGQPVEPEVMHRAATIEAHEQVRSRQHPAQLFRAVRTDEQRPRRAARREALEHPEALGIGPVQVLEDDEGGTVADSIEVRLHDGGEPVGRLGDGVEAEGVERELERTAE